GDTSLSVYASIAHSFRGDDLREVRFGRVPDNGRRPPRRGDYEMLTPYEMSHDGAFYYVAVRQRDLPTSELFVPAATGVGGATISRNKEALFDAVGGYRFSPHFSVAVRAGLLRNQIGSEDTPLPADAAERMVTSSTTALAAQPDFFRAAAVIAFDDRDVPRN